ncbi:MAG: cytochrome c biogenesis protein CcsA [Dehalococcoidia bacterium]
MADLSIYLFWAGLVAAAMASVAYWASTFAPVAVVRARAATSAGTMTVTTPLARSASPGPSLAACMLGWCAAAALAGAVLARWQAVHHAPYSNLYEFTVAFAMGIALSYVGFEVITRQRRVGLVAWPIVLGMLLIATQFPSHIVPLVPALQNGPLLTIHVAVMMLSYAVLTVAFSCAVIYLVQGGEGKRRFASLPRATTAGDLAHKSVMVGFPLLGLGIALGAWWANSAWGRYWGWDPKETSALVTWLSIAAYFHARAGTGSVTGASGIRKLVPARVRRGWRPDPMWWLVGMWALVMFTYFGVNLWISGLHSYAGV